MYEGDGCDAPSCLTGQALGLVAAVSCFTGQALGDAVGRVGGLDALDIGHDGCGLISIWLGSEDDHILEALRQALLHEDVLQVAQAVNVSLPRTSP